MISKNTVIAFLILTAVLFGCTWALIDSAAVSSSPAGAISRAGYYIITTTSASPDPDLLWIANVNTQRLVVYGTSTNGFITPLASADLRLAFQGRFAPDVPEMDEFREAPQFPELPEFPAYP